MKTVKSKLPPSFLLVFMLILSFRPSCYADKGIFNPKINPDEILITDMPATISVSAEIGDVPMNDINVFIHETTRGGTILKSLCEMNLDTSRGLFTGRFTINRNHKSSIYFKIFANYNSQETFESSILRVDIYEPLPEGTTEDLTIDLKKLENNFKKYLKTYNLSTARKMVLNDAKKNPNITEANLNERTLSILYKGSVRGILFLDDLNKDPVDSLK